MINATEFLRIKAELRRGDVLHFESPYESAGDAIITEVTPSSPYSRGGYSVVLRNYDTSHITHIFDHLVSTERRGIGFYLTGRSVGEEYVKEAEKKASEKKLSYEKAAQEEKERNAKEFAELPKQFPELITTAQSGKSSHANGAANIRRELRKAFPQVKFSIKSKSYSGGDSITVYWMDGPITEDIEKITRKYQKGNFNGMEDIYEYNHENQFPDIFGGAKYIHESRRYSDEAYNKTAERMGYPLARFNGQEFDGIDIETGDMIKRETWQTNF